MGLISDHDIDYLCVDRCEILVNDDDHEDLIRVTKINNLLGSVATRLEFEDFS